MSNPFTSARAPTSAGLSGLDLLMPDVALQQQQAARQQALAEALRQQALAADDTGTQFAGGWAIPNGASKPLSRLANALGANIAQRGADQKQQALANALAARMQGGLSGAGAVGGAGGPDLNTVLTLNALGLPVPPKVMERVYGVGADKQRVSVDTGGAVKTGYFDPVTGATTYDSELPKGQTPDSKANIESREKLDALGRPIEQQRADAATSQARSAAITAGGAGGFAGTGIDAQAMNIYTTLTLREKSGQQLTPQESMMRDLAARHLMQPRVVGTAEGGMSVINAPPLPTPGGAPPAGAPAGAAQPQGATGIPGGPTITPLTQKQPSEGERKDAGFAARMRQSGALLEEIGPNGQPTFGTATVGQIPGVGGVTERLAQTSAQQKYRQAQEDWVRAKLRKESGAVIGPKEMEDEIKTYFPQPGDGPDVVAQKTKQRELATSAMEYAAGNSATVPLYQQLQITRPGAAPSGANPLGKTVKRWDEL